MEKTKRTYKANIDGYFDTGNAHQHFHFDPIEVEIWSHWTNDEKRDAVVYALLHRINPEVFNN